MIKLCGIYTITNIQNNKIYLGCSIDIYKRFKNHKISLNNNKSHNIHLQSSWNKYGESNFIFEILEEYDENILFGMENYWCNLLKVHDKKYGYNILPTSPYKRPLKFSKEMKDKMSEGRKGINNHRYGTKMSNDIKENLRNINKNRIRGPKERLNMSIAQKKRIRTKEEIDRMGIIGRKKVGLYDNNNLLIKEFNSLKNCYESLNISLSFLSKILKGDRKSKKYNIKYIN